MGKPARVISVGDDEEAEIETSVCPSCQQNRTNLNGLELFECPTCHRIGMSCCVPSLGAECFWCTGGVQTIPQNNDWRDQLREKMRRNNG